MNRETPDVNYSSKIPFRHRLAGAFCAFVVAQTASAFSLSEAVEAVFQRQPDKQLEQARRELAAAIQGKAEQPFAADPSFSVKHETDVVGSDLGYRQWEGGVELPLWWPGQAATYQREAARTLDESRAMADARRLEIAGEVRDRLWQLALAKSAHQLAESALVIAEQLLHDVERRVDAGELPRSDSVLARSELLTRQDELARAATELSRAQHHFSVYTGFDDVADVGMETPSAKREVSADHPGLQLAEAAVTRARAHRERVSADRRSGPVLWLGARNERPVSGADYESSVALQVSLPFGSEAHAAPELAQAQELLTEAQVAQDRLRLRLQVELEEAAAELDAAQASKQRAVQRKQLAEESLNLSRRAFELGEADLIRLLQSQEKAIGARFDAETRAIEYARAAARLNQALGVLPL